MGGPLASVRVMQLMRVFPRDICRSPISREIAKRKLDKGKRKNLAKVLAHILQPGRSKNHAREGSSALISVHSLYIYTSWALLFINKFGTHKLYR